MCHDWRRYEDGGRVRPVIHRASTVEIIVPYGDPRAPFHKKCAFDVVDYGLGFSCSSLELGCDCLGHIKYFDAILNTNKGEPLVCTSAEHVYARWYLAFSVQQGPTGAASEGSTG
jgi:primary-amine oxidase